VTAYNKWLIERLPKLDELEDAHVAVGGVSRGRRFNTQQINYSYAVMLTSQFQGYCRDLHDECVDHFVGVLSPVSLQTTVAHLLKQDRKLDRGNPNPSNIGSDFNRFGLTFWPEVSERDQRVGDWQTRLTQLTNWRNAIAHQDFDPLKLHGIETLTLNQIKKWRNACNGLARVFDSVMRSYLEKIRGSLSQ